MKSPYVRVIFKVAVAAVEIPSEALGRQAPAVTVHPLNWRNQNYVQLQAVTVVTWSRSYGK
jgi:hypothetical protein